MQSLPVLLCVTVRVPKQQDQQRPLDRAPRPAEGPVITLSIIIFIFFPYFLNVMCILVFKVKQEKQKKYLWSL